jgi:hypothetical protein
VAHTGRAAESDAEAAETRAEAELKAKAAAKVETAARAQAGARTEARVFRRQVVFLAAAGLLVLAFAAWRGGWGVVFGPGWWRW